MPIYSEFKTYRGGFYHNVKQNGVDDRVYSAEDMRLPYNVMYTDGIKPVEDGTAGDTLKVSATGGMGIAIAKGYAQLGGAWFINEALFNITLDTATDQDRYDCVIIQNDDTEAVREPMIYVKSLNRVPTVADLTREGDIYELCIAYVKVPALAESISNADIVDTRDSGELCNVMSGVGAVVVRTYRNTYFTESANQTVIPIGVPQFDHTRDQLTVIVEGRIFDEKSYTVDNKDQITMAIGFPIVGTKVEFEVAKNVNAAGADTVVKEVETLMHFMNSANKVLDYHYYCNGINDNIVLSEMAQTFLDGSDSDHRKMTVHIYGQIGFTAPYSGSGTNTDPYVWFMFGKNVSTNRKIIWDFENCSRITIVAPVNTYNTIFGGHNLFMKNVSLVGNLPLESTIGGLLVCGSMSGKVQFDSCGFILDGARNCIIAYTGIFNDCYLSVTNVYSHSLALYGRDESLLIVNGGEFYAFSVGSNVSACLFVETAAKNCVVKADKMNCPTYERDGFNQTQAIRDLSKNGLSSYRDTITTLVVNAENQLVEGTAVVNKPNRL
jgi:hypothetical protein